MHFRPQLRLSALWRSRLVFLLGLSALQTLLIVLEWRDPFYFTHNDNHRQILPVMLNGLSGFFATGIPPVWDAYSGLGMPVFHGTYALFYPALYAAYALAGALGNTALTLEYYAGMHILGAYMVMYPATRRLGATPLLAACAAFSYAASAYSLTLGRVWPNVTPAAFYMALLILLLAPAVNGQRLTRAWAALTALAIGAFYYADHAQLWVYGMASFAVALLWALAARGKTAWRDALIALGAGLGGLALAAPLMYVQWKETELTPPYAQYDEEGAYRVLGSLLSPFADGNLYAGGIYAIACAVLLLFTLRALFRHRRMLPAGAFAAAGLLCFLLNIGDKGLLWSLLKQLPMLKLFRYIDKWILFLTAFLTAGGVWMLARAMLRSRRWYYIIHALALLGAGGSVHHALYRTAITSAAADRPYPVLPPMLDALRYDGTHRLISVGPHYKFEPRFVYRLNNNYPSYYGIFSANRYNQRVSFSPNLRAAYDLSRDAPNDFLSRYAVGRALVAAPKNGFNDIGADYDMTTLAAAVQKRSLGAQPVEGSKAIALHMLDVTQTDPLVGWHNGTSIPRPLAFSVRPDGLRITLQPHDAPADIVAAFLSHRWFRAYALPGWTPLPLQPDPYNRLRVTAPAGATEILLTLELPWLPGFGLGSVLLLLATATIGAAGGRRLESSRV